MNFFRMSSRLFGLLAGFRFPKWMQNFINEGYVKYFKIDMSDFKNPRAYASLNALFTRALEVPRHLDEGFIAPCDGVVFQCGESFFGGGDLFALSIKGHTYSIYELLRENFEKKELENGLDYVNIYLSPRDYHRYHAPCDMQILSVSYTRGHLYSVAKKYLGKIANLYTKNERVSLKCQCDRRIFWLVFVGAQNVGKMRFCFDESLQSYAKNSHNFTQKYENLFCKKGEELGRFELGSTIIVLAQKGLLNLSLKEGQALKFGEKIAGVRSDFKI